MDGRTGGQLGRKDKRVPPGVSLLTNVGLAELIAQTPDDYVEVAARLAADPGRLARLRSGLRARMAASPLMDAKQFTRCLEAAYVDMLAEDGKNRRPSR